MSALWDEDYDVDFLAEGSRPPYGGPVPSGLERHLEPFCACMSRHVGGADVVMLPRRALPLS